MVRGGGKSFKDVVVARGGRNGGCNRTRAYTAVPETSSSRWETSSMSGTSPSSVMKADLVSSSSPNGQRWKRKRKRRRRRVSRVVGRVS